MSEKPSFFAELKRRNVYKVAVAYAVVAWLLIQVATQVFPFFDIPNWAMRVVVLLLVLGFPVAHWSYNIAYVHAFRGDTDKAFEWLDKAVQYQDTGLSGIAVENLFDKIHSDPRWLPFLRKLGKAPEQLAKIGFKVTLPP